MSGMHARGSSGIAIAVTLMAMGVGGCASRQLELSERETANILAGIDAQVAAEKAEARTIIDEPWSPPRIDKQIEVPLIVGLTDALEIAAFHNRDLATRAETLILSAVALRNAQNDVGLRLAGSMSYLLQGGDDIDRTRDDGASLSLTELLPTGAEVSISGTANRGRGNGDTPSTASGFWEARISQPLLRGFGYDASHEALTDAEQQALYDVRDFDLSRQDLALRVQSDFYNLVAQQRVIANRESSLESYEALKKRSEALFEVGRASEIDKFRSTRDYLDAENALIDAQQEFDSRLDRFKILLGLDTEVEFEIANEIPEPIPLDVPIERIFDVALAGRLDLMTARDQVADAERRLRNREQDILPSLELEAVNRRSSDVERHLDDISADRDRYSVGLALELPLDRVRERGALRRARIELDRSRRNQALLEDQILADVRDSVRNLRSAENSYDIQTRIAVSEEKNVRIAELRFENGEISNRDLTDALGNLADAQDRLVREKANVATARLQLLRDAGLMFMKEDGSWEDIGSTGP
jgi:outer membrane protein TolC